MSDSNDATLESMKEISNRISRTFRVLGELADGIVMGNIRALIVSGAGGVGKTRTLTDRLRRAEQDGEINLGLLRGVSSPIGLYTKLYEFSDASSVLMLDDCDVFKDPESVSILKCALDTGVSREVSWNKDSKYLDDMGVPNTYVFNGAAVFITNINFADEINRSTKNAEHYKAFVGRTHYVDMGIYSRKEILVRLFQVSQEANFRKENKVSNTQCQLMMAWVTENIDNILVPSIRTLEGLADLIHTSKNWEDTAAVTMLKHIR